MIGVTIVFRAGGRSHAPQAAWAIGPFVDDQGVRSLIRSGTLSRTLLTGTQGTALGFRVREFHQPEIRVPRRVQLARRWAARQVQRSCQKAARRIRRVRFSTRLQPRTASERRAVGNTNLAKRLYVGNLPFSATESELRELFESHGELESVRVITDRETGRSRGFAFVEFQEQSAAEAAMSALDGRDMGGRPLRVNEANERERRPGGGGGGGGGGRRY